MTRSHRIIAVSLIALLILTGVVIGRVTKPSNTNAAEESKVVTSDVQPQPAQPAQPVTEVANQDQFYLSDFKTGYNDGYQAGLNGQTGVATVDTSRQGYNEGYKEGYTDAYQAQAENPNAATPAVARTTRERVVYRTASQPVYRAPARKSRSKLKTALTIAAPAAIGAGIGAMFGGKKGAGIGALLGGGGGAIYELRKRRNRD